MASRSQKSERSDEPKNDPTKVPLGSGMADKAKKDIKDRKKKIDDKVDSYL